MGKNQTEEKVGVWRRVFLYKPILIYFFDNINKIWNQTGAQSNPRSSS